MKQQDRWSNEPSPLVIALRAKLDEDGVTYRGASSIVGPSAQTIANWAKGTVAITLTAETQRGLATLLDITPRAVLELAGYDLGGYIELMVA